MDRLRDDVGLSLFILFVVLRSGGALACRTGGGAGSSGYGSILVPVSWAQVC
jgi:hypothetical protein